MKKQFIAVLIIAMLIASVNLFAATAETDSVTDTVSTVTDDPTGIVVSLGLSHNNGVIFSLQGPQYKAASPGAPALASGGGTGITYGFGARLQYTLYDAGESTESFQIDAALQEATDADQLNVGISDMPSIAKTIDTRTSGSIGSIVTTGGSNPAADDYIGVTFNGSVTETGLTYFLLSSSGGTPESVTLIDSIDCVDTWTGTTSDDGAQLFYELLQSDVTVEVVYTLKASAI